MTGLSPRALSRLSWIGLVGVLIIGVVFAIWSTVVDQRAVSGLERATRVGNAYRDLSYGVVEAQLRAQNFIENPTPSTRAEFDFTVATLLTRIDAIERYGDLADRALVADLVVRGLPALERAQRAFAAIERGDPVAAEALPGSDTPLDISAALDGPARQRHQESLDLLESYAAAQRRDFWMTLVIIATAVPLLGTFVYVMRHYARREAEARLEMRRLERAALTDGLTGLGNHRAFQDELKRDVARATRAGDFLSLAMIDLDEFKDVNDRWGHGRGDLVLAEFAGMLKDNVKEYRTFRVGGDEFAVVLPAIALEATESLLERVRQRAIAQLGGVTISIGLAALGSGDDAVVLREKADAALYEAKRRGRNAVVRFDGAHGVPIYTAAKVNGLRQLLHQGRMDVAYQPIWDMNRHAILGFEALARPPADYGLEGPQEAFDIAERLGRAHDLDAICRRAALARGSELPEGALLFINISPRSLDHSTFSGAEFADLARASGLSPSQIVIEITERSNAPIEVVKAEAAWLREHGFRLALDDVGSGNAGLEMLRQVPVDYVKIDRSVLVSALSDSMGKAVLSAIIAEGIENEEMLALVRDAGRSVRTPTPVHGAQGYLLGRPSERFDAEWPLPRAA